MESQQDVAWDWNAIPGPNNLQEDSVFKSPPSSDEMIQPRAQMMDRRLKPNVEVAPKCPRCDSANTKFCYYNNYSLSQPRYFCKTCRRYWTKGGSLRNVPVGGGCRKNKRSKRTLDNSSSSHNDNNNSSSSTSTTPTHNEINLCSPPVPPPGMDQMNLPAVPSVYFSLLEGAGSDALNVGYSTRGFVDHHHAALMAGIEVSSSSGATDLLPPLPNLPNLAAALQSFKGQSKGEQQQPRSCTGTSDLTHVYDTQVVSSSPDAFGMVRDVGGINNPPHMVPAECDLQQWQSRLANNMLMDDHNALRNLINSNNSQQHHEDSRSLVPCNWQLPSENGGLLDNNMNMGSYNWNVGGAAWSDLSSYIPSYSNPLI